MENFIDDLRTEGFAVRRYGDCLGLIDLDDIDFIWQPNFNLKENVPVNKNDEIDSFLFALHLDIQEKFLKGKVKQSTVLNRRLWEGFVEGTDYWHNDFSDGPNVFFLLYFDDMSSTNDGAIWFKNDLNETRILPTPGTLIGVCQDNPSFLHKAEKTTKRRIAASFEFSVDW